MHQSMVYQKEGYRANPLTSLGKLYQIDLIIKQDRGLLVSFSELYKYWNDNSR